jgi:hypothetical protein
VGGNRAGGRAADRPAGLTAARLPRNLMGAASPGTSPPSGGSRGSDPRLWTARH